MKYLAKYIHKDNSPDNPNNMTPYYRTIHALDVNEATRIALKYERKGWLFQTVTQKE